VCGWSARILLNSTTIENAHKVRKKKFDFLLCIEVQQTFSFPFPNWNIIKCLNASVLITAVFELAQQFYHATEIGNVADAVSRDDHYPVCQLDIRQDSEFATGSRYRKIAYEWEPDTDIRNAFIDISKIQTWKKLRVAQSFIHYFQKHLFSLLCHDSESVYGVISFPSSSANWTRQIC